MYVQCMHTYVRGLVGVKRVKEDKKVASQADCLFLLYRCTYRVFCKIKKGWEAFDVVVVICAHYT